MRKFLLLISLLVTSFSSLNAQTKVILGDTTSGSLISFTGPMDNYSYYYRSQTVYTAAELTAVGMVAFNEITDIAFLVAFGGETLDSYTIRMGHTTATNVQNPVEVPLTTVRNATPYTPQYIYKTFDSSLNLDNNFVWNGIDNIVIDICISTNPTGIYNYAFVNSVAYKGFRGQNITCNYLPYTTYYYKPVIQLTYITGQPCQPTPTALSIGSITESSASASFSGSGSAFIVEYGAAGFTPGTNGTAGVGGTVVTGNASPIALTGLIANTTYDVYVRQDCTGSGNGYGYNSSKATFTAVCTPAGDEVSYGNDSWKGYVYTWTGSPSFNASNYKGFVTENEQFDRDNGAGAIAGLTTNLCPPAPSDNFTVRYKMTKNFPAGYYKFSVGGDDGVRLSVDGGITWLVNVWNDQSYTIYTSTLVYLNGSTNLVLEYYDNTGDSRISFSYTIPCTTPTALSIGSITATSASASFTSGGSAFIVEYGAAGFTPGTDNNPGVGGTVVTGTASPIAITGLTESTSYDVYVRQNCTGSGNGYGYNSSKATFTAVCTPAGDEVSYGNDSWKGYVYTWTGSPSFNASNYKGLVTENEQFDRDNGAGAIAGLITNLCPPIPSDNFTVRYKMTKNFPAGYYKFSVGGDDGVRLSIDGGSTWLINSWIIQSYTIFTSSIVYLNGSTNLVLEYYDNTLDSRISFSYTIPCTTPTALSIGSITATSASASFTSAGTAFIVEYGAVGFTPGTDNNPGVGGTIITGSASPIAIAGLTGNTTYDVYVRQDCTSSSNGYSTNSSKVTFTTQCDAITTYPFTEGFNDASLPACWFAYEGSPGSSVHWQPVTTDNGMGAGASAEGSHFLRMNHLNAQTNYNPYYLKSVAFNLGATAKRAKFSIWMGAMSGTNNLKFEISTDDGGTWTTLSTYTANPANNNSNAPWENKIVNLTAYTNQTVLFRLNATKIFSIGHINIGFDNFRVEEIPPCTTPTALSAGSINNNVANISFTSGGNNFIVEYGAVGFTPGTNGTAGVGGTIVTGSASPITITGLTANTTYDVYVRQDCTSDANGYSTNSSKVTFTTLCNVAVTTYPFTEGFNNASLPTCWFAYEGSPGATYHWQPVTTDGGSGAGASAEGSHFLRMYYNEAHFTYNPYYLKSVGFNLGATAKRAKFSIWMGANSGTNNLKFEISTDGGISWTTLSTYTANPANNNSNAPWVSKTVDLSSYTNQTVLFRLNATSNYSGGFCNIGFDNFRVEDIPACTEPEALSAGSITNNAASVSFTGVGNAFVLEYGATGFTPGTDGTAGVGGTVVTGTASPIAIAGLTGNTTYDVYIRQDCTGSGNGYSINSDKLIFTTLCDAITTYPFTEGFNAATLPSCWSVSEGTPSATQHWQPVTADATHGAGTSAEGSHFLRMNYFNASTSYNPYYIKSGVFNLGATAKRAKFSIWMGAASGTNNLKFEISTDDGGTWTTLSTYTANPTNNNSNAPWENKIVNLTAYTNQTVLFRLNATSNFGNNYSNIGFDNFRVEEIPPCTTPTALSAGSITNNAANISFTSGGNNFIVEYGAAGFTPGTNGTAGVGGTIVTGSASPITITGLTANTTYDVYVRQDCTSDANGYSTNSSKVTFTTLCNVAVTTYPFTEGFNNASLPTCWFAYEGSPGATQHWQPVTADATYGAGASAEGSHFLRMNYFNASTSYNPYYIKSGAFNLGATAKRAKFSIWMGAASGTNNLKFEISTDGGGSWATLSTYTANPVNTSSSAPWDSKTVDLSSYTNQTVLFRLNATSNYGGNYCNIGFDNFRVEDIPACLEPEALSAGSITNSSASVSFTSGGNNFIVEYGAVGFTPVTNGNAGVGGTIVTGSSSPITISGLTANSTYDVYVRQDCTGSGNGYSENSSKVTFTTLCDAITTYPFTEGFNAASLPACWFAYEGSPGATQHWQPVTADASNGAGASAEGSHFLRMNYSNANPSYGPYYLKSGAFNLGVTAKRAKFSIWMGANSGTNNLKFEISTDDGGTWTTLNTYTANPANNNANTPWENKIVNLTAYTNQTVLFRLNATSNYDDNDYCNIGFDNFRVEEIPPCTTPTALSAGSINNNAANISFTSGGNNFIVEYGAAGFTPGTNGTAGVGGTIVTGTASPIAITGLTGTTTYDVYVRQDCTGSGNGYSENSSKVTFTTLCDAITTYPFTEGFNAASLPACWFAYEGSPGATQHWQPVTADATYGAGASAEGSHFLRMNYFNASTSYNPYYLKSVPFNLGATAKRAKFSIWMGANSGTNNLKFEISTDDGGTWTTLNTYTANPANNNANTPWENKIVNLTAYTNQTVLFRLNATSNYDDNDYCNIGFDNFRVEEIPPCTTPTALSAGSINNNAANISFTSGGNNFIVEYGAAGFTPGTNGTAGVGGTIVTGTASPIAITGLTGTTTYDVYVRQDCTSDANGYSPNSAKLTFTTLCNAAITTYPFTEGFNSASLPTCWLAYEGSPGALQHWQPVTTDGAGADASAEGSHFLRMNYNGAPTNYNPYYLKSVGFNLGATAKRAKFSIWMGANSGTNNLKFEISTDGGISWTTLSTYTANPANNTPYAPWVSRTVDLSSYTNQTVLFRLNATSNYGGDYCNIGFDNFKVEDIPACLEPEALSAGSITNSSASVSFTSGGNNFIVEYGAAGFTPGTDGTAGVGGTIVTGSTSPIALTGLTANTTYDVYVRQNCTGNGYSVNSDKLTFTTLCDAITTYPFTEGFNAASLPACWFAYEGSPGSSVHWQPVTADASNGTGASAEGSHFLRMNYYSATPSYSPYYLKSVPFNLGATAKRAKFSIWMGANSGTNNLKFEISTDGGISWTTLSTYTANPANNNSNAPWEYKIVNLTAYTNQMVLFRLNATPNYHASGSCNIGFDNFRVEDILACLEPEALSVGSLTNNSASVSFTGIGTAFVVEYGAVGFTPGTNGTAGVGGTVVTGTTSPIAISGLTANTTYDVYVRQDCTGSGNGYSYNSIKATFTTLCNATNVPYTQNFESATVPALPACTSQEQLGLGNTWAIASNPGNGFTSKTLGYEYNSYNAANVWFYTQGINLTQGVYYTISYRYGNADSYYPEKLKVAYGTLPSNGAMTNTLADHTNINQATAQSNTVTFTPPSTGVYYFGFKAYSDTDMYLLYVDDIVVDAIAGCSTPTALSAGSITNSAASISFTGAANDNIVEYGAAGFTPGTNNTAGVGGTIVTGNASPINLTGLTGSTTYDVYVRHDCGNGIYTLNSIKTTFTTLCNPTNVPYTQNFETATVPALPACTSQENLGQGNNWTTASAPGNGFTSKTLTYNFKPFKSANVWFYTQGINLTAGSYYTISYRYGNTNSNYSDKLKVAYGALPSNGAMTNTLADHTNINQATAQSNTVSFTPPSTGVYYFGFKAYSPDNISNLYVDDIVVDAIPGCSTPTALSAGSITNSAASISFTGAANDNIVEYGAAGFTPGTNNTAGVGGTIVTGNASPINLTGLTGSTTYDVYVRHDCGNGIYTLNSIKATFTTQCNPTNVPYTQNFESATTPALPACTSQENLGQGNYWVTVSNPGNGFTSKNIKYAYSVGNVANVWFYTQGVNLTVGTYYTISYRYGNNSAHIEKLKVAYGTLPSNGAMTNTLADHPNINQASAQSNTVTFTPPSTGVYYFGFKAYSDANRWNLYVDDIVVDIAPHTWTGNTDTDWNKNSNWDRGSIPTSISNVIIPNVANKPVLGVNYPLIREANNITIQTGSSLTIRNESSLLLYGNIINNGSIIADTGKIAFVGTTLQTFNTGSTDISIESLSMDNAVGLTVTGTGKLNIIGHLFTYKQGVLTTNNLIVLKSNENGTAFFQSLFNNLPTINGNITVERYIPAKASRKWSFLASPINQSLQESWQQQIHITGAGSGGTVCPTLTAHTNGFDATLTNAPNAYTYDASQTTGNRWQVVNNTNTTMLGQGIGFRVNVRGPRSLGCDLLNGVNMVPSAVTLSTTGTLSTANKNLGTFSITYPNNGINNWVLIGNPYPGHLGFNDSYGFLSDVSNSNNIGDAYAVYIPSNNAGIYTYWSNTGMEFTGGTGYNSNYGDFISSGQAVFVQSKVVGNLTLNFNEDMKQFNPGVETGYFRNNKRTFNEKLKVSYGTLDNKIDEIVVRYANDAAVSNTAIGKMDIPSMNYGTYITSLKSTTHTVVQTRSLNTLNTDEVLLNVGATKSGNYKLNFSEYENFTGADIYLVDHLAKVTQDVKANSEYVFSVDVNNTATKGSNRFSIVFTKRIVEPSIVNNSIKMYPNPANKQVTLLLPQIADINYNIKVTDMAGKIVLQQSTAGGYKQLNIEKLSTGTYIVEIIDSKGNRTTEKLIKS